MSAQPDLLGQARRWVEKAEHDLLAARHSMSLVNQGLTDVVCFHCQQAAEKYLKGLLILNKVAFPRTHDLRILLELALKNAALGISMAEIIPLNRYAIEGRYPGEWDPIEKDEAAQAVEIANKLRQAIYSIMPEAFDPSEPV